MTKDKNLKKTLSIRISTDGFCFCDYIPSKPGSLNYFFYNTDKEKSLAVNFRAGFEEAPFADKENYSCIKCIVETAEFTAIPLEYDDRNDYKQFFKHCFPHGNSNMEIVANRLNAQGYTIIFPVDKCVYEEISSLGETSIYTPASILAGFITNAPFNEERYMLAYFQGKHALFRLQHNLMQIKGQYILHSGKQAHLSVGHGDFMGFLIHIIEILHWLPHSHSYRIYHPHLMNYMRSRGGL